VCILSYNIEKRGTKMIIKNPKFEISAVSPKQYPNKGLPEIVLAGKSNVREIILYKHINKQKKPSKNK
jgi:GTP-binding protein EngB required for normal cell division